MTLIECSANKAYSVETYDYEGQRYLSINRMYRKKGDKEWSRGKGVSFSIGHEEDIETIRRVMRAVKKELLGSK